MQSYLYDDFKLCRMAQLTFGGEEILTTSVENAVK